MDKEVWEPTLIDDIFQSLKEIEVEEGIPLTAKAFIADCLSFKLEKLSYRKLHKKLPLEPLPRFDDVFYQGANNMDKPQDKPPGDIRCSNCDGAD